MLGITDTELVERERAVVCGSLVEAQPLYQMLHSTCICIHGACGAHVSGLKAAGRAESNLATGSAKAAPRQRRGKLQVRDQYQVVYLRGAGG